MRSREAGKEDLMANTTITKNKVTALDLIALEPAQNWEVVRDFCGGIKASNIREHVIKMFPEILEHACYCLLSEQGKALIPMIKGMVGSEFVSKYRRELVEAFNTETLPTSVSLQMYTDICSTADKFGYLEFVNDFEKAFYTSK